MIKPRFYVDVRLVGDYWRTWVRLNWWGSLQSAYRDFEQHKDNPLVQNIRICYRRIVLRRHRR